METERQNLLEIHKGYEKERKERARYGTERRRLNKKAMVVLQALLDNTGLGWETAHYINNPAGRFLNKAMGLEFRPLTDEMHHILEIREGKVNVEIDLKTMLDNRKMDTGQKAMAIHKTMLFICETQFVGSIGDILCGKTQKGEKKGD